MKTLLILLALAAQCHAAQLASWYLPRVPGLVAASRLFPVGALVKVTEIHNGSWVIVKIIERGPNLRFTGIRVIDLSPAAFQKLDALPLGLAEVTIRRIK